MTFRICLKKHGDRRLADYPDFRPNGLDWRVCYN
jgi:hypothetical protein